MTTKNLPQTTKSINYLKKSLAIAITVLVLLIAAATFAREEVIDGQLEPDRITDTQAWEQLFLLLQPDGRWHSEGFMENWLKEGGLNDRERTQIVATAWRYQPEASEVDNEILLETMSKRRDDKKIDNLVKLRKAKLYGQVMELARELDTMDNINKFLHEEVKKHTTSKQASVLGSLVPILYAQGMTGTVTKSIVMSQNGRYLAAKGAANTGGAFGHTTKITTKLTSPRGRVAIKDSGTTAQIAVTSTAYMDLCNAMTYCEDGWFNSSMVGNIYCRYGGSFPQYSQASGKNTTKFVTLLEVKFTNPGSETAITSMPRQNGNVLLRARVGKSPSCGSTFVRTTSLFNVGSGGMRETHNSPTVQDIPLSLPGGLTGAGSWSLKTLSDNTVAGSVAVQTVIEDMSDCPALEKVKNLSITVN